MINELDRVVLTKPVAKLRLEPGDVGTVVLVHEGTILPRPNGIALETGRKVKLFPFVEVDQILNGLLEGTVLEFSHRRARWYREE